MKEGENGHTAEEEEQAQTIVLKLENLFGNWLKNFSDEVKEKFICKKIEESEFEGNITNIDWGKKNAFFICLSKLFESFQNPLQTLQTPKILHLL